jgi:hypothetical protein
MARSKEKSSPILRPRHLTYLTIMVNRPVGKFKVTKTLPCHKVCLRNSRPRLLARTVLIISTLYKYPETSLSQTVVNASPITICETTPKRSPKVGLGWVFQGLAV